MRNNINRSGPDAGSDYRPLLCNGAYRFIIPPAEPMITEEKHDAVIASLPDNFCRVVPELYHTSQSSVGQMHTLEKAGV
jgi:hypothetical protein